jgi:hypothetical protein
MSRYKAVFGHLNLTTTNANEKENFRQALFKVLAEAGLSDDPNVAIILTDEVYNIMFKNLVCELGKNHIYFQGCRKSLFKELLYKILTGKKWVDEESF